MAMGKLTFLSAEEIPNLDWLDLHDTYMPDESKPNPPHSLEELETMWDHSSEDKFNLIPNKTELHRRELPTKQDGKQPTLEREVKQVTSKLASFGFTPKQTFKVLQRTFPKTAILYNRDVIKQALVTKKAHCGECGIEDLNQISDNDAVYNMISLAGTPEELYTLCQQYMEAYNAQHKPQEVEASEKPQEVVYHDYKPTEESEDKSDNYRIIIKRATEQIKQNKLNLYKFYERMATVDKNLTSSLVRAKIIAAALQPLNQVPVSAFDGCRNSRMLTAMRQKLARDGKLAGYIPEDNSCKIQSRTGSDTFKEQSFKDYTPEKDTKPNYDALISKARNLVEKNKLNLVKFYGQMAKMDANLVSSNLRAKIIYEIVQPLKEIHKDVFKGYQGSKLLTVIYNKISDRLVPKAEKKATFIVDAESLTASYTECFADMDTQMDVGTDSEDTCEVNLKGGFQL
jgi:hypothetical protein